MILSVELPDQIAKQLHLDGPRHNRRALEMLALEGYRSGMLSRGQISETLGLSFQEAEQFLHDNGAELGITLEDIAEESAALHRLLAR